MSLNSILNTARLGLSVQQTTAQIIGQNIANATTPGYTRQRTDIRAMNGGGVEIGSISRIRDSLLDTSLRGHLPASSGYAQRASTLARLSTVFNEPAEDGLAATLDQFWSAWADLANMPDSTAAKSVVQQRGAQLGNTLNRYSDEINTTADSLKTSLNQHVSEFNRLAGQVASLNREIISFEAGGATAATLRDNRDRLLDSLAGLAPISVTDNQNGSVTVHLKGTSVVDGVTSREIRVDGGPVPGNYSLTLAERPVSLDAKGGALGATLQLLNYDIPQIMGELDALAGGIVSTVNTMHRTGWSEMGELEGMSNWDPLAPPTGSNIDFFSDSHTTAATIRLSNAVAASAGYVAAGNVEGASGNNGLATSLSQLRSTSAILKSGSAGSAISFGEFYRDFATRLGVSTNDADVSHSIFSTLALNAEQNRSSMSGVSIDEELVSLTVHQQAYSAAARVITTAESMLQTLLDMVR